MSPSCPHASGGVPKNWSTVAPTAKLSPREWGCTATKTKKSFMSGVVPTRVGVYRVNDGINIVRWCCPHASGGVPRGKAEKKKHNLLSPREWGCTCSFRELLIPTTVVPTRVGVYRARRLRSQSGICCPHASGGVPIIESLNTALQQLSPREWGCTAVADARVAGRPVVPTRVGVYRNR